MALANVSVSTSTFFEWITRTNQLIVIANRLTEGQANSTGTLTLTNSGGVNGGVTLNVSSGLIKGDAGLATNLRSSQLTTNTITLISNSATLTVSGGSSSLGKTIYLDIGTLSIDSGDISTVNIASANIVNVAHSTAVAAFDAANNAVTDYSPAYNQANTARTHANAAFAAANTAVTDYSPAYNQANTARTHANAAFAQGNTTAAYANSSGITFPNGNTVTNWTVSTSTPSGGANGDVWIQISA